MPLVDQGFNLLLFGMGTVFVFLSVLVLTTMFMSKVAVSLVKDIDNSADTGSITSGSTPNASSSSRPNSSSQSMIDPRLLTVLQAAVDKHRGNA